jgi:hypothetical protein
MANEKEKGPQGPHEGHIQVTATYVPARKPFEGDFPENATVGEVKAAIMTAFGIEQGPTPDGKGQVVFHLFDKTGELTDMGRTIADVAAPGRHAQLNLVKQIIQGA